MLAGLHHQKARIGLETRPGCWASRKLEEDLSFLLALVGGFISSDHGDLPRGYFNVQPPRQLLPQGSAA